MKIIDVPQTGKIGLQVAMPSRWGQLRRALVTPANPRTSAQMTVRNAFASAAAGFDALTTAQQDAWNTAASNERSRPTLGQSGPLTGLQLFARVNTLLALSGEAAVTTPPAKVAFEPNAPQSLVITAPAGVVKLALTCPNSPGANTIVMGSAPQRSGVRAVPPMVRLGACPMPVTGSADITGIYAARFGAPPPGMRVFVAVQQVQDGQQSLPSVFHALVPAAA